jgi:hypothetical protein
MGPNTEPEALPGVLRDEDDREDDVAIDMQVVDARRELRGGQR